MGASAPSTCLADKALLAALPRARARSSVHMCAWPSLKSRVVALPVAGARPLCPGAVPCSGWPWRVQAWGQGGVGYGRSLACPAAGRGARRVPQAVQSAPAPVVPQSPASRGGARESRRCFPPTPHRWLPLGRPRWSLPPWSPTVPRRDRTARPCSDSQAFAGHLGAALSPMCRPVLREAVLQTRAVFDDDPTQDFWVLQVGIADSVSGALRLLEQTRQAGVEAWRQDRALPWPQGQNQDGGPGAVCVGATLAGRRYGANLQNGPTPEDPKPLPRFVRLREETYPERVPSRSAQTRFLPEFHGDAWRNSGTAAGLARDGLRQQRTCAWQATPGPRLRRRTAPRAGGCALLPPRPAPRGPVADGFPSACTTWTSAAC